MIDETTTPSSSTARKDYLVDFLGSVNGLTNTTGSGSSNIRYKPFGTAYDRQDAETIRWTGNTGSMHTGLDFAEQHNRARFMSTTTLQWTTRDPLWPSELPYGYVNGNPVTRIDPSGMIQQVPPGEIASWFNERLKKCGLSAKDASLLANVFRCIAMAESNYNPVLISQGPNGSVEGIFQIGSTHDKWCSSKECRGKMDDWKCNADTALRMFIQYCNDGKNFNIFNATAAYWGVCRGEGKQFFPCLERLGITEDSLKNIKCPKRSKDCPDCSSIRDGEFSGVKPRPWPWPKSSSRLR